MTLDPTTAALLRRSAPLAHAEAPARCHVDPATGVGCNWYHGPWQYFRLLELVSTAAVHEDRLVQALRNAARTRDCTRVLVSGSTDYAMLALVLDAWAAEGVPVDVTVIDLCPTPLWLCEWYARERGVPVTVHATNVLDYDAAQPFDVVCTHAFMGYFDAAGRAALARRWYALLRPGGRVVTTQRLRPGHAAALARFTPEQAAQFHARAAAAHAAQPGATDLPAAAFAACADAFTRHFTSHPVRTRDELVQVFNDAGFRPVEVELAGDATPAGATAGPSVPGASAYAHVLAHKP